LLSRKRLCTAACGGTISELAIEIEALSVKYPRRPQPALDNLSLQIARGSFFALLGPNGAGKTTLISFLCGQLEGRYQKAQILGCGRDQLNAYKRRLGYAPQEIALFPTLSARENLRFFAHLQDVSKDDCQRVLNWVELEDRANDPVQSFSGGMKRRLNLAVALLNRPDLLILDEPMVGVDPQSRNFIFEKILELRAQGVTLIYSTHYLEEAQRLCDSVGIIANGQLMAKGPIGEILGSENLERRYLEWAGRKLL
jgi:ABC-2 type transport system ATP-binding protein